MILASNSACFALAWRARALEEVVDAREAMGVRDCIFAACYMKTTGDEPELKL